MTKTVALNGYELDSYRYLHHNGADAFMERYGMGANVAINRWADRKLLRVSYAEGSVVVKTFNKYAL